tara:strand:- start:143 stop:343 length:201 start_codon:yes stop_codon:yes gene_type:complete
MAIVNHIHCYKIVKMVEQKYISKGLFKNIKEAKSFWINTTNKLCSMRTERRKGKVELFIKQPFYIL